MRQIIHFVSCLKTCYKQNAVLAYPFRGEKRQAPTKIAKTGLTGIVRADIKPSLNYFGPINNLGISDE
jgi:hypothetical protein